MSHAIQQTHVSIRNIRLAMLVAGDADAPPIVLLHGIPSSAELFRGVMPFLVDAGYRVYAPYMAGYGYTRLPEDVDYSLSTMADILAIWLEQENIKPVWLVGHDLGGAVAQFMAVRYPYLLSHLTLSNTVCGTSFPVFPIRLLKAIASLHALPLLVRLRLIPNPYTNWQLRQGFGDASVLTKAERHRVFWDSKFYNRQGRIEFQKHLRDLTNTETAAVLSHLRDVTLPTLLLWGGADGLQPYETVGKSLHRAMRHRPDVTVLAGVGHFSPMEAPEQFAQALLTWQRSLRLS